MNPPADDDWQTGPAFGNAAVSDLCSDFAEGGTLSYVEFMVPVNTARVVLVTTYVPLRACQEGTAHFTTPYVVTLSELCLTCARQQAPRSLKFPPFKANKKQKMFG